ncbi:MAG: helix-turn-helix transcriptional regulator [Lentimicrobiaceae bacterium]|nr:helix-turn-helix transcriptional regulator [Lentimicrobiaceae bacterium]MCO5266791.1 helix-turn-helix transcriptional regulator [Lentimicrobium sp.]HPG34202.1 helix-turn-helix transcriptional regulator [Lentimicrobium sp.]
MEHIVNTSPITSREREILKLVVREYSTVEISDILRISVRTVETHRKNILRKINSKSLVGLTKHAIKLGLVEEFIYNPGPAGKKNRKSDIHNH